MNPLVSIIIPSYNYEKFLPECIVSCMDQTYKNIEIIVVDDYSTDNSFTVALEYASIDSRVKILAHPDNRGYSAAKNTGIRASKGEFIAHIDADDILLHDSIEIRLNAFKPEIDMVHALAWRYRETDGKWHRDGYNKKAVIHAQTILIRRSVYERFGLYYEKLRSKADKEMTYRLGVHRDSPLPKLIKAKKINEHVSLYRKTENQMHKVRKRNPKLNEKINKRFEKRIKKLKKEGITRGNTEFL
jgi:glycosyltransferase involved in cell wall biosynthesis